MPILFIVLLTAALYYLGSRALITSWLWSRYPAWLSRFMDCAACTGFWYGLGVTLVLGASVPFDVPTWSVPIIVGLCSMVWTPLIAALMQISLERLGSVVPSDTEEVFEIEPSISIKDIKVERVDVEDPPVPIRDRKVVEPIAAMLNAVGPLLARAQAAERELAGAIGQRDLLSQKCYEASEQIGKLIAERDEARADLATYKEQSGALCSRLMYERDEARAACERLRERLVEREAQLDAHRGKLDSDCVEHVELNGHLDIAEQALDWMAHEIRDDAFDTKVQDFRASLRIVIDQCVKQRLRGNWYIASYDAGRAKLVEHWQAKTAEAIAAFIDAEAEARREEGFSYRAISELVAFIRSNAWRPSPATDKEE